MRFFVKAIATGFAMSMGSAIFKKVSDKMGLEGEGAKAEAQTDAKGAKADSSKEDDEDNKRSAKNGGANDGGAKDGGARDDASR